MNLNQMHKKNVRFSDNIQTILINLKSIPGVRGALIFSSEGNVLGSDISPDLNAESLIAICTKQISILENYYNKLNIGATKKIIIEYESGKLIINKINDELYVAMIVDDKHLFDPGDAYRHRFFKKASMKQGVETEFLK
jgi:predicted regulator of Ras-like GTPase activity (Roadblock/LC7/MglB family)